MLISLLSLFHPQAGMFPVVSRKWKVSPKKRTVWDNLDSDSDYKPSDDEGGEHGEDSDMEEGKGKDKKEVSNVPSTAAAIEVNRLTINVCLAVL